MQLGKQTVGQYEERFRVVDKLKFFSGHLILAKTSDGGRVFLQEIEMNRFVPPGLREVLRNFHHPHVAPILDVIEENDRIILVHPPLVGEPLSLLVDEHHPMKPRDALRVFRRMLRTLVDLSKLPLPMTTTLDPRNIIMNGDRPYVLFLNFKKLSRPRFHEKWRGLLYFLLTGTEPKGQLPPIQNLKIPPELMKLIEASFDPNNTIHDVLALAERTRLEMPRKKKRRKRWFYPVAAAVLVAFGVVLGMEFSPKPVVSEPAIANIRLEESRRLSTVAELRLTNPSQAYSLDLPIKDSVLIRGELSQGKHRPFFLALVSNQMPRGYGVYIDELGKVWVFESINGDIRLLNASKGEIPRIGLGKRYVLELVYQPEKPLYVTIRERNGENSRGIVGPMPIGSPFWIQFQGGEGTVLHRLKVNPLEDHNAVDRQET